MTLLTTALRKANERESSIISKLLTGKITQHLIHTDSKTGKAATLKKEEDFSQILIEASSEAQSSQRTLAACLEQHFRGCVVDFDSSQAFQSYLITELPPVLIIQIQVYDRLKAC